MAIVTSARAGLAASELGANLVQLRGLPAGALESEARLLVRDSPVPVLVSSRIDVALAAGAAGVNLPEADLPVDVARRMLGAGRLIGRSVHDEQGALDAEREGADYVIFGPVFQTPSHPGRQPAGLDALSRVAKAAGIPVIAIGGIDEERGTECVKAGAAGYAAIRLFRRPAGEDGS